MSLEPPIYIQKSGSLGAPIKYKWNNELALRLYADKDQNVRLYVAIDAANFKSKMSLGVALAEWIVWRFENHVDLTDAKYRIEAAWASTIDPRYAANLSYGMTHDADTFPVESALELGLCVLGKLNVRYMKGSIYLAELVVRLAVLARHLAPDKKFFDVWLSEAVRRIATTFPRTAKYDRKSGIYDASNEKPVPREFFDPTFNYTEVNAESALVRFLAKLDPTRNIYLRSAAEMKTDGFVGIPYTR